MYGIPYTSGYISTWVVPQKLLEGWWPNGPATFAKRFRLMYFLLLRHHRMLDPGKLEAPAIVGRKTKYIHKKWDLYPSMQEKDNSWWSSVRWQSRSVRSQFMMVINKSNLFNFKNGELLKLGHDFFHHLHGNGAQTQVRKTNAKLFSLTDRVEISQYIS